MMSYICTIMVLLCAMYYVAATYYDVHHIHADMVLCTTMYMYDVHRTLYIIVHSRATMYKYKVHRTTMMYDVLCTRYIVHRCIAGAQVYTRPLSVHISGTYKRIRENDQVHRTSCTSYIVPCTSYEVHRTLYLVRCTMYDVHVRCT